MQHCQEKNTTGVCKHVHSSSSEEENRV